eukprot:6479365-Amphidinium_carterae.2
MDNFFKSTVATLCASECTASSHIGVNAQRELAQKKCWNVAHTTPVPKCRSASNQSQQDGNGQSQYHYTYVGYPGIPVHHHSRAQPFIHVNRLALSKCKRVAVGRT